MIELRALAYFVVACRSLSFALAAKELGIAASTLTTAMKALEHDLGLALFRRINNGLYPTAAARGLMHAADPLLMAEVFARRWVAAPPKTKLKVLTVDIGLSYTIGGMSGALGRAIDGMGRERPDIFVDALWTDEKDLPYVRGLADDWKNHDLSRVFVTLTDENQRDAKRSTTLFSDQWVFACRLPAGTRQQPSAADLAAGRLVVPLLSPALIEQADQYFSQHQIGGVRFLNDHPGDLPRLIDDHPAAALFVPRSLISPRLGLANVAIVEPDWPLTMRIVARAPESNAATMLFMSHLTRALANDETSLRGRPIISLKQIHYFNIVHRVQHV